MTTTPGWSARALQWPRGDLNPQHPSNSARVVCRLPTGPSRPPPCQRATIADRHRSAECPAGVEPACPVWKTDAWAARPRALRLQRKERESNPQGSSLVRVQAGCRRQSACPSVSVWMAGFEPAWSGTRGRRMKPGSPTSRASFAPSPRPTKKARGRVTPGLKSHRPEGSGVTAVGGTR